MTKKYLIIGDYKMTKSKIRKYLLYLAFSILSLDLFIGSAFSFQKYVANDGDVIRVRMSLNDLTRINVEGGRIEKLWGTNGSFDTEVNKIKGELFLKPRRKRFETVSFFVEDNFGSTYTLVADLMNIPSESIVLSPTRRTKKESADKLKNPNFIKEIKKIFKAMFNENDGGHFSVEKSDKYIPLWKETEIYESQIFHGENLLGEVWIVKNVTKSNIKMTEEEFINAKPNTIAISIEKHDLESEESTRIFSVRRK
jgi:hypothetical protein